MFLFVYARTEFIVSAFCQRICLYYLSTKKITNNNYVCFNCNNKKCTYKQYESIAYNIKLSPRHNNDRIKITVY